MLPQPPPSPPNPRSATRPVGPNDEPIQPSQEISVKALDILCGRGKLSINHAGNKHFRQLVTSSLRQFAQCGDRKSRASTIQSIVDAVHATGGRFLKIERATGRWHELSDPAVKNKVGHALRDALNSTPTNAALFEPRSSSSSTSGTAGSSGGGGGSRRGTRRSAAHPPDRTDYPNMPPRVHEALVGEPGMTLPGLPGPEMTGRSLGGVPPPPPPGVQPWSPVSSLLRIPPQQQQQQQQLMLYVTQPPQAEANDNPRASPSTADTNDHGFLDVINQTLGPLSSEATDPIERLLG